MTYPITKRCYDLLYDELEKLKKGRAAISARIDEARGHGDLKENAEYHAAREEQSLSEGRIAVIESKLSEARIVYPEELKTDKVYFGSTIKIKNMDTDEIKILKIVSEDEVSISNGRISNKSPIAKEAIGKVVNDSFTINTPRGEVEYLIIEISVSM